MNVYWCELAWLGGPEAARGVVIEVDQGGICAVTSGHNAPPPGTTPLRGLTLPALANAHSHAFHRALRSRTQGERGTFWTWRDLMYRVSSGLDPDNYYRLARAVFAEMAMAGIGVVGEFHYVHHRPGGGAYDDPNAMGASLAAAATDAGIRLTLLDTLYLHGGFAPGTASGYAPLSEEQARFSDGSAEAWADRVDDLAAALSGPNTAVGAAVHSVRAVDPTSIGTAARWAAENRAPLHVHISEQPAENRGCLDVHGRTPIGVMAEAGGLGPRTTLVHATHASQEDISLVGEAGANVCLCPTTERDLADGIGPSKALAAAGARLCVGSDSHAIVDLFEETRAVEMGQRVTKLERRVHSVEALAEMATRNGYRSLGWTEGGVLTPGSLADFATLGLDSVRLAGSHADIALASAIFAASNADVRHLVVGGEPVVVDGTHVSIDVASELDAIIPRLMTS